MDNENIEHPEKKDSNLSEDNIVEDLQASLNEVLSNTSQVMSNLLKSIDTNITDKKTRDESRDIINKLFSDLNNTTQEARNQITQAYTYEEE
jgi:methionyl-tRNA synthetase